MVNEENLQNYMGYQWLFIEGDTVTVGVSEEGLEEFESIDAADLPNEDENVSADEVCGSLETDDGPLDIYSPIEGQVIEVNPAVVEDASIIKDDPTGEGWLFKVEAENIDDLRIALEDGDDQDETE